MDGQVIKDMAYKLPVNNIIKVAKKLGTKDAFKYKEKLIIQVLKLIEQETNK